MYIYASCDRQATYPVLTDRAMRFRNRFTSRSYTSTLEQRKDFAELTAANELDIARIDSDFRERWGADLLELFTRLRPLLSPSAWHDCKAVLDSGLRPILGEMYRFDANTRVTPTDDKHWLAQVHPEWATMGGTPNGGYLEEDAYVWDSKGALVAKSRQLGLRH
ncbi:hypothetical protein [Streptomyces sp. ISL-1]|uniref:hypothetical protein n=1 Tax=Streptomyces sp. ISL-1 TaxID=2817657 RepID=UPI0035AB8486